LVEKAGTVTQTFYIDNVKVEQSTPTLNSYPIADVVSAQHYYPFGSTMQTWEADGVEYAFGFNGMEKDNDTYGEGNAYDFGARIYDSRLGRWLSLDPLMEKYPGFSPYNFVSNSPISLIDPDGKDNIIYLIALPDAEAHLKKLTPQQIADQANANFKTLKLNTEVRVVTPEAMPFIVANRDATDGIAVLGGSKKSVSNFLAPYTNAYSAWPDIQSLNPEKSLAKSNSSGKFIALDASDFSEWSSLNKNLSFLESTALLINHGAGHNAGNSGLHERGGLVNSGGATNNNNKTITDPENNIPYREDMMSPDSYGNNKPQDNLMRNFLRNPNKEGQNPNLPVPFQD
jgi:RHS repeat-associated protein